MSLTLCVFMHIYLKRENARRDAAMIARGLTLNSYTEEMKHIEREKGDNATVSKFHFSLCLSFAHFAPSSSVTLCKFISQILVMQSISVF
jgi:hypothetical protein